MVTPRIQYALSEDGTEIAYAEFGVGPPLVLLDSFLSGGLDVRLQSRRATAFFAALAANRRVIAFDWRNSGLSGPATTFTIENMLSDVESVTRHVGAERFDLWALQSSGHIALEYALTYGDRLRKVVFSQPRPRGAYSRPYAFGLSLVQMATADWDAFTELYALRNYRWTETASEFMEELRKQWTKEKLQAFMEIVDGLDPLALAPRIESEAVVLVRSQDPEDNVRAGRRLAAMLPQGELIVTPLDNARDPEQVRLSGHFLGDFDKSPSAAMPFRVILFTDIESHTEMMHSLGDTRGREILREHERMTRQALRTHGGTEVKNLGDGFMASFGSARQALDCAIDLQRMLMVAGVAGHQIRVRVGINAGEPIAENDDLFGSSVILAQRTAAEASGGQILVTDVVRQLAAGKGFEFTFKGEHELRGFSTPVPLHELRWQAVAEAAS
jgi:pimeloyl-ACP methyl ester carboxylesterase